MAHMIGLDPKQLAAVMYNQYHSPQADQVSRQAAQHYEASKVSRDIAAFQANPKNKYFNGLRQDMSLLVQAGGANDLQSAYRLAIRNSPKHRILAKMDTAYAQDDARRKSAKQSSR